VDGGTVVYDRFRMSSPRTFAIAAWALLAAACSSPGDSLPSLPDAGTFDTGVLDVVVSDVAVDASDADADAEVDAGDADAPDADAGDADGGDAGDADAGDADAAIDAEAGAIPVVASQGLVSAGGVSRSGTYQLAWTLGQSTPNAGVSSSSKYRLRGGVVGATGSPP
jgi:hypothetical protein